MISISWHACWPRVSPQPCALGLYHTASALSFAFPHALSLPKPVSLSGWRAGAVFYSEPAQDWTSPVPPCWSPACRGWREYPAIAPTSRDVRV